MTLLDATPPKPPRPVGRYALIALVVTLVGIVVTYRLWDYPEERAVSVFLNTLKAGDFRQAYNLWQPSESYTFNDFLRDWGPQGDYGKIRDFAILSSKSRGSETVSIMVRINGVNPPLLLLVDRKTKGLAYSPF